MSRDRALQAALQAALSVKIQQASRAQPELPAPDDPLFDDFYRQRLA